MMRKGGGVLSSLSCDLESLNKKLIQWHLWEAVAPNAADCGTWDLYFWNCHKKLNQIMFFFLHKWTPINFFSLLYVSNSNCCISNTFSRWNHKLWLMILGTWPLMNQIRVHKEYWQDKKNHQFTILVAKYNWVQCHDNTFETIPFEMNIFSVWIRWYQDLSAWHCQSQCP